MVHDRNVQNTAELRSQNMKRVLDTLRMQGPLTKQQIVVQTGLSMATINNILSQMMMDGWLKQKGFAESRGGRMPMLYTINPHQFFFFVINFAIAQEIRMALVSIDGQLQTTKALTYQYDASYEDVLALAAQGLESILEAAGVTRASILGSSAAVSAIFDHSSECVVNSTITLFENRPMRKDLCRVLNVDIFIENDANTMALSCKPYISQRNNENGLIFIYVGEGLGVGIIYEGKIMTGSHGYGSEISHIPMGHAGYRCYCGKQNCIETELSLAGFIRKYHKHDPHHSISSGQSMVEQWEDFARRCQCGEPVALEVAQENAKLLGQLIALLVNLLDPNTIIIGGYVDQISEQLLPTVKREIFSDVTIASQKEIPVRFVRGYNRLILSGCGELAYMRWDP